MLIVYIKREGEREGERERERERAHVQVRSACVRAHAQVLIMSSFECSVGSRFFKRFFYHSYGYCNVGYWQR